MNADPKELKARFEPKEVTILKPDRQMSMVRVSPCGKLLVAACHDGTLRRWDLSDEKMPELPPLAGHNGWVTAVAFAPEAGRFYTADSWGQLRGWSYGEAEPVTAWHVDDAHDGWIRALAVSPDGTQLATAGFDQQVRVWSAADGKQQQQLTGHKEDIFSLAFHPDGKSLVSGDFKGVVKQWNLADGQSPRQFDAKVLYALSRLQDVGGVRALTFDAEGKTLACAGLTPKNGGNVQGAPTVLLFDWEKGDLKHTIKLGADGDGYIYELYFHAEGFFMAVTSGNPGSGKLLFHRPGDEQPFFVTTKMPNCHSLGLHPNGIRLVVSATNGGSNGNGRPLKEGEYQGNHSPLYVLDMPQPAEKPAR